jgi:S-formylglutathione hydrolase
MSFETTGTIASFGGKLLKLKHKSSSTNTDMELNLFMPPQATKSGAKIPVLFYLSGLTCTGNNCSEKGFFQHGAAKHGIAVVYPDTSPRGLQIEGEDESYDFGSGAGFYVDATKEPWTKGYNMYSYITKELPEALFSSFKELDSSRVSITGHSMGGHGALTLVRSRVMNRVYHLTGLSVPQEPWNVQVRLRLRTDCQPHQLPVGTESFQGILWRGSGTKVEGARRYRACQAMEGPAGDAHRRGAYLPSDYANGWLLTNDQGTGDNFYNQKQLLPENLIEAAKGAGNDKGIQLRMQPDYDHSYYFMASFADDHVEWAAKRLGV